MKMPKDFNEVQAFGGFTPIKVGGHVCVIKKVEEVMSKNNNPMIRISLDTDRTDSQPNYYMDRWNNDNRPNKRWGCVVNQLVYDAQGATSRGFKTFIEMVEQSNNGFKVQWGDNFEKCFVGKLVGGVFGREEYLNSYGESKFATKCTGFRTVQDVREGKVEAPKDKLLNPNGSSNNSNFDDIAPVGNENVPF